MSKISPLDTYSSLWINRGQDGVLFLDQQQYIEQVVESHLSPGAKPAYVPCDSQLSNMSKDGDLPETAKPYSELVGMLQWVANGTRPDVQFAVNQLSQFLSRPSENVWRAAHHVLRYLNTTKEFKLQLGSSELKGLLGYSDADWASTVEDRRSTTS